MDLRRLRSGSFTGYHFTGSALSGYPFTGYKFGQDPVGFDLAFVIGGNVPDYTLYTREGDATAELPDGSPVTVAQDVPPFEYVGGQKLFRQSYSTDNRGTTSLQINDIATGAYQLNGTSDRITLDNPVILGTSDFNFKATFRPSDTTNRSITGELENGAFIVRINSGGTISIIESGISTVYTSTLTVAVDSDVDLEYNRLYSGTSTLTVNGISESVTDNRNYDGQNGILFSRLVGEYFEGYAFTAQLSVNGVTNFSYSLNGYRRDTEIVDTSGNGNHGTSTRTVDNLLVENQGFGVSGEDARKPWTDDFGEPYGLAGILYNQRNFLHLIDRGNLEHPYSFIRNSISYEYNGDIPTQIDINVPPRDDGRYRHSGMMQNLVPNPEDPSLWERANGVTYDPATGCHTIPNSGYITLLSNTASGYENQPYANAIEAEIISGLGKMRIYDGVGVTDKPLSGLTELYRIFDPAATRITVSLRSDDSGTPLVARFSKPRVYNSPYLLPYIPSNDIISSQAANTGSNGLWFPLVEGFGKSYAFNGVNDGIRVGSPVLNIDGGRVSIYVNTLASDGYLYGEGNTNNAFSIAGLVLQGGNLRLFFRDDIGTSRQTLTTETYNNGEAYFVELKRTNSEVLLYVDAVLIKTLDISGLGVITLDTATIGALERGAGLEQLFGGALWDCEKTIGETIIGRYPLDRFRADSLVEDISGNDNHGTSANPINTMYQVQKGFGTPVDIPTPYSFRTADGVRVSSGALDLINGRADGVLLNSGNIDPAKRYQIITTETDHFGAGIVAGDRVTGLTTALDAINTVREISDSSSQLPLKNVMFKTVSVLQRLLSLDNTDWIYIDTDGRIKMTDGTNIAESPVITADTLISSIIPKWDGQRLKMWIEVNGVAGAEVDFTGHFPAAEILKFGFANEEIMYIEDLKFAELQGTTGTILYKNLTPHDTSTDVTLLEGQNGTAVAWFDSATSKIKITDGTNTAESANTVTQGVNIPELRIVLNETEMWITDSTQGTKATFVGYLPELGNRALAVSDSEYLTVSDVLVDDDLAFDYVYHNGELVTHNGDPVIVYK